MNRAEIEHKLRGLGLDLPPINPPVASYVPAKAHGTLLFVSGQLPIRDGAVMARGSVPSQVDELLAAECARRCALGAIAAALGAVPEGREILGVARVGVWVASDPGFTGHPKIANGASDLLVEVFGASGRHARAAVGSVALPLGTPVEVEVTFEIG